MNEALPLVQKPSGLSLVFRNWSFGRFWLARTASHIGDGAALIALLLYVKSIERSGIAVGALLVAQALPHLTGPVLGTLVDRVDLKRLLIGCDLAQALLFASIAWWQPPFALLLAAVALASLLDTTYSPAASSMVPQLVNADDLLPANAWIGSALNFQVAIGPMLGGLLVSAFGVRGALGANAVSFLISAVLLVTVPRLGPARTKPAEGVVSAGLAGLAFAWKHVAIRALVGGMFLLVAFAAVDNVALVFLARDSLHLSAAGFGVVAGVFGFGMLASSVGLLAWRHTPRPAAILVVSWFITAVSTLLTGLAPNGVTAGAAQAAGGLANGAENVASDTLVQRIVPGEMLGRLFGLVGTAAFLGSSIAYLLAGVLLDLTSPRVTFIVGGLGSLVVAVVLAPILWQVERRGIAVASAPSARI